MDQTILMGILIPFIGTAAGAGCVFFMKRNLSRTVERALMGFASGVMVAASIWSLLIPAMEQCVEMGKMAFLPSVIGFWIGILFLLFLDSVTPHLHLNSEEAEGPHSRLKKTTMMVLAVTLHNIPEGMYIPENQTSPMSIVVNSGGRTYEAAATLNVTTDGKITIKFDESDPNFPRLANANNVSLRAQFQASFDGTKETIHFSDKVEKQVIIDDDDHS